MEFEIINKNYLDNHIETFIQLIQGWQYSSWNEENFMYELPLKWQFSFGVYENEKLLGFCFASNKLNGVYYIHLIFISSEIRGKSIGKKMIEFAKNIAKQNNINKIELRCPESNTDALTFYKKNGFSILEIIKDDISGNEADCYLTLDF